jgi:hypothetical protein
MKARRPGGIAQWFDPELPSGGLVLPSFTCGHCNGITVIPAGKRAEDVGGDCYQCWRLICPSCAVSRVCYPFMRWVDEQEELGHWRRQIGLE